MRKSGELETKAVLVILEATTYYVMWISFRM